MTMIDGLYNFFGCGFPTLVVLGSTPTRNPPSSKLSLLKHLQWARAKDSDKLQYFTYLN